MSSPVTSKQTGGNHEMLKFVVLAQRVEPMRRVFGLSPSNEGGSLQSSDHTSIVQPILWSIDVDFHGEDGSSDLHQTQRGDRNVPRP